jgi:MFS family permease
MTAPARRLVLHRLVLSHLLTATAASAPMTVLLAALWQQTHSAAWIAAIGLARTLPYVLLSGYAGVLADRADRRQVLAASGAARAALLGGLALALTLHAAPSLLLSVYAGVTLAGLPAYPALAAGLPEATRGADRRRRNAQLATAETVAWAAGPALGGLLLGLGFVAATSVATALLLAGRLLLPRAPLGGHDSAARSTLTPAVRALRAAPRSIRWVAAAIGANVALGTVTVLLPAIADAQTPGRFGWLAAALGIGAAGAPLLARQTSARALPLCVAGLPLLLVTVPNLPAVLSGLTVSGAGLVWVEVVAMTRIQDEIAPELRARLFGLVDSLLVGGAAVGALIGPLAAAIDPVASVAAAGLALAAGAGVGSRARPRHPRGLESSVGR